MQIHIRRNGQKHGPYSEEQTRQMLAAGQLSTNDHAMREGDAQWVPLGELLGARGEKSETSNRFAETVGGLSLRKWDNIIQAVVVAGGVLMILRWFKKGAWLIFCDSGHGPALWKPTPLLG